MEKNNTHWHTDCVEYCQLLIIIVSVLFLKCSYSVYVRHTGLFLADMFRWNNSDSSLYKTLLHTTLWPLKGTNVWIWLSKWWQRITTISNDVIYPHTYGTIPYTTTVAWHLLLILEAWLRDRILWFWKPFGTLSRSSPTNLIWLKSDDEHCFFSQCRWLSRVVPLSAHLSASCCLRLPSPGDPAQQHMATLKYVDSNRATSDFQISWLACSVSHVLARWKQGGSVPALKG